MSVTTEPEAWVSTVASSVPTTSTRVSLSDAVRVLKFRRNTTVHDRSVAGSPTRLWNPHVHFAVQGQVLFDTAVEGQDYTVSLRQLTDGIRVVPNCSDRSTAGAVDALRYLRGADAAAASVSF